MNTKRYVAILALILVAAAGSVASAGIHGGQQARTCYPAAKWAGGTAAKGQRPCYTVARMFEDGSGRLVIGTARKAQAVCIVPNVSEERGSFAIRCQRR